MPFAISFSQPKDQPTHSAEELALIQHLPAGLASVHSPLAKSWKPNRFFIEQLIVEVREGELPFSVGAGGEVDP